MNYFMKMNSVVNAQTTSEEPVTCIALKEHKHQDITNSVAMMKDVVEPWTKKRVARRVELCLNIAGSC